jgi:Arc/MetJ family transcription regulator
MRTNIVLDDKLVAEAMKLTRIQTKREVVELALREMVARRKRKNVLELVGQDLIAPDYDVRAVRAGMNRGRRSGSSR